MKINENKQKACGCGVGDNGSGACDSSGKCTCKPGFSDSKCTTCSAGFYLSFYLLVFVSVLLLIIIIDY